MMDVCQQFTDQRNLKFSVSDDITKSKTKCIIFTKKKLNIDNIVPIYLEGKPLKYVDKLNHLGNTVQSDNSMKIDVSVKRRKFIGKVNILNQEFYYSCADVKSKLYNLFILWQ